MHTNAPRRPFGRTVCVLFVSLWRLSSLTGSSSFIGLTIDDVLTLSPKFWEIHQDPIVAMDGGAVTLITIQVNLTSGTIAHHAVHRPELVPLVDDLLNYRKQYVRCIR